MSYKLTDDDRGCIQHLMELCSDDLTDWEVDFLDSIRGRDWLTPKQKEIFDGIWGEVVVNKIRGECLG